MSSYASLIAKLISSSPSTGPQRTLEHAKKLDKALGFPSLSYPVIHVAGSNGKGSVSYKIGKALELGGCRVGLYTSPHLFSFRERIVINDAPIGEEKVVEGLKVLFKLGSLAKEATFFELATFLAFESFRSHHVDVAVIETGIGGRLDATNVVSPCMTVITSISREHSQILGETLEEIAAEKGGILKPNVPIVLGSKAVLSTITSRAQQLDCPIYVSTVSSPFFDEENSSIAQLALSHLPQRFQLSQQIISQGIMSRPSCRFEVVGKVIFDVAHNPDAVISLIRALFHFDPSGKFRFLVGFSKDKEFDTCLRHIAQVATHIHLVASSNVRGASTNELACVLAQIARCPYSSHSTLESGADHAFGAAQKEGEYLVVCGSFYIMEGVRKSQFAKLSMYN